MLLCVQHVLRSLFCLGLLGRYGAESIEAIEDEDIDMSHLLELYKYFLGLEDFDIKARALQVPILYTFDLKKASLQLYGQSVEII